MDGRDDAVDAGLHGVRHFIGADHVAAMEGEKVVAHAGGTAGIVGADGQINLVQLGQLGRGFQHGRGDGALGVQNAQGIAAVALGGDFEIKGDFAQGFVLEAIAFHQQRTVAVGVGHDTHLAPRGIHHDGQRPLGQLGILLRPAVSKQIRQINREGFVGGGDGELVEHQVEAVQLHGAIDAHAVVGAGLEPGEAHAASRDVLIGEIVRPVVGAHQIVGGDGIVVRILIHAVGGEPIVDDAGGRQHVLIAHQALLDMGQGVEGVFRRLDGLPAFTGDGADGTDESDDLVHLIGLLLRQIVGAGLLAAVEAEQVEGQGVHRVAEGADGQIRIVEIRQLVQAGQHFRRDGAGDARDADGVAAVLGRHAHGDGLARQIRGLQAVAAGQRMDGGSAFRRFGGVERHRHVFDGAGLGVQDNGHGDIPRALVVQQLGIALLRVVIGQEESNLAAGRDLEIAHFQMPGRPASAGG